MLNKIFSFYNYTLVPVAQTAYYICRYGLEGAQKKADEKLTKLKIEVEVLKGKLNAR